MGIDFWKYFWNIANPKCIVLIQKSILAGAFMPRFENFSVVAEDLNRCKALRKDRLSETLFIIPCNDGEAKRACDIIKITGAPYLYISKQKWGATLDKEWDRIPWDQYKNIKSVCIFEMPGLEKGMLGAMNSGLEGQIPAEAELLSRGLEVKIIDHHTYGWVDRYDSLSSLEQLCAWIGWDMSDLDIAIAVNDRSYIPGLRRMGLSQNEIRSIRRYDLLAQGNSANYIERQISMARQAKSRLQILKRGDLWILEDEKVNRVYLLQELALESPSGIAHILEYKRTKLGFSGSPAVVNVLLNLDFGEFGFKPGYANYGGGDETGSKFWGFKPAGKDEFVSIDCWGAIIKLVSSVLQGAKIGENGS
ncbi:MAG: hypothetical protein CMP10_06360 [Zetaproteobacteria bacterium]|nr:hypothetical protein [Pseudobdellovibrionaceae bacterium]